MFFNKYNFKINNFCDKSNTRVELSGVFINPKLTCATDSFTLIEISSVKANSEEYPSIPDTNRKVLSNFPAFILPREKASNVVKLFSGKTNPGLPILDNAVITKKNKEMVEIGRTDLESYNSVMSRVIQGEYPKYNDIMVERGKFIEIAVNPVYLAKIASFLTDFISGNSIKEIIMKIPVKENQPVRFYAKNEYKQQAKALLMPMRKDEDTEKE